MEVRPTVFIIDDDKMSRDSMCALACSIGLPYEAFSSAEAYLDQFDAGRPGCVIVDLRMPGMSGTDLQKELTKLGASVPVIVISAYATTGVTVEAMQEGAVSVIDKPYRDDELWDAIRIALKKDALERQQYDRRQDIQSRFDSLDLDERLVLDAMISGKSNKETAILLDVSLRTVEARRSSIYKKTKTCSFAELVALSVELRSGAKGPNRRD